MRYEYLDVTLKTVKKLSVTSLLNYVAEREDLLFKQEMAAEDSEHYCIMGFFALSTTTVAT